MDSYVRRRSASLSEVEGVLHGAAAPNLKAVENLREMNKSLQAATAGGPPVRPSARSTSAVSAARSPLLVLSAGPLSLRGQHRGHQEVQPGV